VLDYTKLATDFQYRKSLSRSGRLWLFSARKPPIASRWARCMPVASLAKLWHRHSKNPLFLKQEKFG